MTNKQFNKFILFVLLLIIVPTLVAGTIYFMDLLKVRPDNRVFAFILFFVVEIIALTQAFSTFQEIYSNIVEINHNKLELPSIKTKSIEEKNKEIINNKKPFNTDNIHREDIINFDV